MNAPNKIPETAQLSGRSYPNVASIEADEQFWSSQPPSRLIWALFTLELIRRFETALLTPEMQVLIHGPVHSSIGQEGVAVGVAMALKSRDKIISTHRAHHHFLAKAAGHYLPTDADLLSSGTLFDSMRDCVRKTLAEIMGLQPGWVGGRGGSMHLYDRESGNIGTQAIVGGNVPFGSGAAFAEKSRGTGNVVLAYLGDGAVSIGPFHEGICIAKVYELPIVFLVENNLYGVGTTARAATGLDDLVVRSSGYNIPGLIVDGMNPLSVMRGVELASKHMRAGRGPVMIEAKTYRYFHQNGGAPGSAYGYRTKDEEHEWRERDPLKHWPEELGRRGLLNGEQVERLREMAQALVNDAQQFCVDYSEPKKPKIKCALLCVPKSATLHVRSTGHEFDGAQFKVLSDYSKTREIKMVDAISAVLARRMETNPEVFVVGEDVANFRGGAYGATRDALARFPARVLNSPIAEGGIVGLGHGAAAAGMKPVVELMFPDFGLIAADELFNQIATFRYMYNGKAEAPLVVRSRCSIGRGFGAQHSGDTVGLFALYPGWRIVAPTTPFDYIGLFNSAIRSLDPVLVLEHHELFPMAGAVPAVDLDYLVPMGKACVRRSGTDVTVAAYLSMVPRTLRIAEELAAHEGIDAEVIDLLTLDHANLDIETIAQSARKTGALIVVEQAMSTQSIGPHIAARIQRLCDGQLRRPIALLSSQPAPMPVSSLLERAVILGDEEIRDGILRSVKRDSANIN